MKKLITTTFTILFLTVCSCSQVKVGSVGFNFGFEKTTQNQKLPENWFQWGSGYILNIDTVIKHTGKNAICIQPSEKTTANSFGCIAYSVPAVYEGRKIELRAYMKLLDVTEKPIGLMLRIDGSTGSLQFDNMQQKKIMGTSDWKLYSVELPYPESAKAIYIGAILAGPGKLWVDDFELLIDGINIENIKKSQPKEFKANLDKEFDGKSGIFPFQLNDQKIRDLKELGLVWGFLKYYHPAVAAGNYNWDYELFRILPNIINSKNSVERDAILVKWINQLGRCESGKEIKTSPEKIKINTDLDWIENSNFSDELVASLQKVKNADRINDHFYIGLAPGPGNPVFKNENPYLSMILPDTGYRILALFRYWNIIQYYFPYKNLIGEDWKNVLEEFIPKIINVNNETEYTLTLLALIARVHDTHANIWGGNTILEKYKGLNYAGAKLTFVENKPVVTGFYDEKSRDESGLQVGDLITEVNNRPVDSIVKTSLRLTPASNYPTQLRDIARLLLRTNDTIITVKVMRDGKKFNKILKTYSATRLDIYGRNNYQKPDTCFKFIGKEIAYINNGTLKRSYLPKIWEDMKNSKGLIIDDRNYPSDFPIFVLSNYLMPQSVDFVKFTNGSVITPGLFTFGETLKAGKENADYYRGKVIILVNEVTQSSAEYHALAYKRVSKATIIGSTTAGADGNVSQFSLPGGISTMISGIGVYYPNGGDTQRVGIVPDIEIKPTLKGIKNGQDELLEKAIEIINTKK